MSNTTKVRIFKPHTHAGKRYTPGPEGIEIEVTAPEAKWLEEQGVTQRPGAKPAEPAKPAG